MEKGPARLEAGKITFRQLAEYAIKRFYQPATYDATGRKVSGVRSVVPARSAINNLAAYFGHSDIRNIDDEALEKFKTHRLKTVSIATVDRELSKARKMFGVARSKKWIFDNPFKTEAGKQLIQVAAEKGAVEQVLSDAEEAISKTSGHLLANFSVDCQNLIGDPDGLSLLFVGVLPPHLQCRISPNFRIQIGLSNPQDHTPLASSSSYDGDPTILRPALTSWRHRKS